MEEGVAMGLAILCHRVTQRVVVERFQHSIGTVHYWFKAVTRALATLGTHLIKTVNRGDVQPEIQCNRKWYPYFEVYPLLIYKILVIEFLTRMIYYDFLLKKCIGAIDGTHVAAWSPASRHKTFCGRKSSLVTQNVMAACSHDMFTFVYAGWEGTANDSRVFLDALTRQENGFPFPRDGKRLKLFSLFRNLFFALYFVN